MSSKYMKKPSSSGPISRSAWARINTHAKLTHSASTGVADGGNATSKRLKSAEIGPVAAAAVSSLAGLA